MELISHPPVAIVPETTAHSTNTCKEMTVAIKQGAARLEGDIYWAKDNERPVMQHDIASKRGMYFDHWLFIARKHNRRVKIDIKTHEVVVPVVRMLRTLTISEGMAEINVDIVMGPGSDERPWYCWLAQGVTYGLWDKPSVKFSDLVYIRSTLPATMITISAATYDQATKGYTENNIKQMIAISEILGGPISFCLRAEWVTPELVQRLLPHGRVDIWNKPKTFKVNEGSKDYFLDIGVNGFIDLR